MKIYLLLLTLAISACSTLTTKEAVYVENDNVSVKLAMAAQDASRSLVELADIEKTRTPISTADRIDNVPRQLMKKMSISWNGPIGPLAQQVAKEVEYKFIELGKRSPMPLLVQIDAIDTPAIDILRNAGLQLGTRASLVVDIPNRNIEVHYVESAANDLLRNSGEEENMGRNPNGNSQNKKMKDIPNRNMNDISNR